MKGVNLKKIAPYLVALALFVALPVIYFSPAVFDNKVLSQGDVKNASAWGRDLKEYYKQTDSVAFWSNTMFSGMPANQTYMPTPPTVFTYVSKILRLNLPTLHLGIVFLYLLGFFVLLISLGVNPWLSIVGAIAYAFASYNIIIIGAGHVNKGLVMATMAPVIGGVLLCYHKKYLWGALVTLVFTGVNIAYEHPQITYYLILILATIVVAYFVDAVKRRTLPDFFKSSALLVAVGALAAAPALGRLLPLAEYSKDSTRGAATLQTSQSSQASKAGLDMDYAFQWSYGKGETMTLLIPNFYGGSSHYDVGKDSELYRATRNAEYAKYAPTYWGDQSFTAGPVYAGAIVCFLFLLGLIIVRGREKWWILAATVLSILLAWGGNFKVVNQFMFDHLPMLNKFRTPSMALVMAGVTMALMAALAVKEFIQNAQDKNCRKKYADALKIAAGVTGGLCLLFALFGGSLASFTGASDASLLQQLGKQQGEQFISILQADRQHLLQADAWRSLLFIAVAAALLWGYAAKKIKTVWLVAALGVAIFTDLWSVDKRMLNESSFGRKQQVADYTPTDADKQILKDADPDYRVFNTTVSPFQDASTSYFHKSIGGYSGAKMRRYQDIIDYHFSHGVNMRVLDMLNTRYFIVSGQNGAPQAQRNPAALGNAWFVDSIRWVESPDEEITALRNFEPATTAIIDKIWQDRYDYSTLATQPDSVASIRLTEYRNPGNLFYESVSALPKLAVFSEVFHRTWHVYIDGKETPLIQVNYILRAVPVAAGKHSIEFRCIDTVYPKAVKIGLYASLVTGLALLALIAALIYQSYRKKQD
jgi:hypothetical protein